MQKAHSEGFRSRLKQAPNNRPHCRFVDRPDYVAVCRDTFADFSTHLSRNNRFGHRDVGIVNVISKLACEVEYISKTAGHNQTNARTSALYKCICKLCRAVNHQGDV